MGFDKHFVCVSTLTTALVLGGGSVAVFAAPGYGASGQNGRSATESTWAKAPNFYTSPSSQTGASFSRTTLAAASRVSPIRTEQVVRSARHESVRTQSGDAWNNPNVYTAATVSNTPPAFAAASQNSRRTPQAYVASASITAPARQPLRYAPGQTVNGAYGQSARAVPNTYVASAQPSSYSGASVNTSAASMASAKKPSLFSRLLPGHKSQSEVIQVSNKPCKNLGLVQDGMASWYGKDFDGGKTANGERYHMDSMTAAHKTLPFGTIVKVQNLDNGRECTVRINNRGPYIKNRVLDLSKAAASQLGFISRGITHIRMQVVGRV